MTDMHVPAVLRGAGVRTQLTKFVTYIIPGAAPSIREDKPKTSLYTIRWAEVRALPDSATLHMYDCVPIAIHVSGRKMIVPVFYSVARPHVA